MTSAIDRLGLRPVADLSLLAEQREDLLDAHVDRPHDIEIREQLDQIEERIRTDELTVQAQLQTLARGQSPDRPDVALSESRLTGLDDYGQRLDRLREVVAQWNPDSPAMAGKLAKYTQVIDQAENYYAGLDSAAGDFGRKVAAGVQALDAHLGAVDWKRRAFIPERTPSERMVDAAPARSAQIDHGMELG